MTMNFKNFSGDDIQKHLATDNVKIIDIRSADAYNGWLVNGENRPGHIKGAKSVPYKWFKYIDWIEIVRHKDIMPSHRIVIYGDDKLQIDKAARQFLSAGYSDVGVYYDFMQEWCANDAFPMQKLARFKHLVPAQWVQQLISGENPAHYNNNSFVVVHAHYRNRDAYLSGHIPGAIEMNTNSLESTETWNRRTPEELKKTLEAHGITADTTVVLYGKFMFPDNNDQYPGSAAGDIGAIRLALIMMYAGVSDVRVLNGGFQSWQDAGYRADYTDVKKAEVENFGKTIPANPQLFVDTPEAKQMLKSTSTELVCVRSRPEYTGEVSGYNYIKKKGHIPGAIFADCGSDAYHMENYRNLDHTVREFHETEEIWKKSGITPEKHLAFYCGTGWRGSEAWFNAWLMGWPNVSVYDGGWFEWSSDENNPNETGRPEHW
jgi:3-mercaptopyruvate sulfurtransferase SseA